MGARKLGAGVPAALQSRRHPARDAVPLPLKRLVLHARRNGPLESRLQPELRRPCLSIGEKAAVQQIFLDAKEKGWDRALEAPLGRRR